MDYNVGQSTYLDVYFIGIINTFVVAVLGILAATVLGFGIGIMRLSNNLVLKVLPPSTSRCYETSLCCFNLFLVFCCSAFVAR